MQNAILGQGLELCDKQLLQLLCFHSRGIEEFDGNYDSDEDADFTKMDMVIIIIMKIKI